MENSKDNSINSKTTTFEYVIKHIDKMMTEPIQKYFGIDGCIDSDIKDIFHLILFVAHWYFLI